MKQYKFLMALLLAMLSISSTAQCMDAADTEYCHIDHEILIKNIGRYIEMYIEHDNTEALRSYAERIVLLWCDAEKAAAIADYNHLSQLPTEDEFHAMLRQVLQGPLDLGAVCVRGVAKPSLSMIALVYNNAELFQQLTTHAIEQGKTINPNEMYNGYALLHYAVVDNNLDAIELLRSLGADFSCKTEQSLAVLYPGMTALQLAREKSTGEVIALLQQYQEADDASSCSSVSDLTIANVAIHTQIEQRKLDELLHAERAVRAGIARPPTTTVHRHQPYLGGLAYRNRVATRNRIVSMMAVSQAEKKSNCCVVQ
ncbi:ankyrin repeat domain-containing protein [Candidatus Dependentiae bacterium]|nr:ankyrin repeat domain-containing protein [Candidatus Dependentiae bacterium]